MSGKDKDSNVLILKKSKAVDIVDDSASQKEKPFIDTTLEKHFNLKEESRKSKDLDKPYKPPALKRKKVLEKPDIEPTPKQKSCPEGITVAECRCHVDMQRVTSRLDAIQAFLEALRDMFFEEEQDK